MNAANLLRFAIRSFDHWLSRRLGVYPFSYAEEIVLRIQKAKMPHDLLLGNRLIPRDSPVLLLHLWNERIPLPPPEGYNLSWAVTFHRLLDRSLHALAEHLQENVSLIDVVALGGHTAHLTLGHVGVERLLLRLGFSVVPYSHPLGAFGEFWENFYTWWLIWAYNPTSVYFHPLGKMKRVSFWIERNAFLERYARVKQVIQSEEE